MFFSLASPTNICTLLAKLGQSRRPENRQAGNTHTHDDGIVGIALDFHDVSAALQRARGRLLPFGLIDLLRELHVARGLAGNGTGILPEHQRLGGNALLYTEMERTLHDFHFEW